MLAYSRVQCWPQGSCHCGIMWGIISAHWFIFNTKMLPTFLTDWVNAEGKSHVHASHEHKWAHGCEVLSRGKRQMVHFEKGGDMESFIAQIDFPHWHNCYALAWTIRPQVSLFQTKGTFSYLSKRSFGICNGSFFTIYLRWTLCTFLLVD